MSVRWPKEGFNTFSRGLTAKQALVTLAVALTLGFGIGIIQLLGDWRDMRADTHANTTRDIAMVSDSAMEAAFQMNSTLAERVALGLLGKEAVLSVRIEDNFGNVLAEHQREAQRASRVAKSLFGDISEYSVPLTQSGSDELLGRLSLQLDQNWLTNRFLEGMLHRVLLEILRAVVISAVTIGVFHLLVTRPLLRVSNAIGKVDPSRPAEGQVALPKHHDNDEMGQLVTSFNTLLHAFQRGLDERDRAQEELTELTRTLERRVADRTHDLEQAHDALARERDELVRTLAELNAAHNKLNAASHNIAESIRYASRIQASLLPQPQALDEMFHDSAVAWYPRDVVGGDFYWVGRHRGLEIVAVLDCTGHGVPGAFMTAIAASVLQRVLTDYCHDDPARILSLMDDMVRQALRQEKDESLSDDGLDAAICVFDPAARTLSFAGANLPLLIAHNGILERIKGDRRGLGYRTANPDYVFTRHDLTVEPGMGFYLFTDGITDQVGGPSRRMFGRQRVEQTLAQFLGRPMTEQFDRLISALEEWRGEENKRDDMTFLAFTPLPPEHATAKASPLSAMA
ncbi:SpoIIE family protein phosphatase [Telmatospirillum sp. J64-1]|uniref:SpoIIE family protein phosphatase n=1 Tax=Telmatospirillum sp. J64-1 TaxID=2502183 RepID=UPI00115E4B5E|nr:SpoIIE family protein phosphatase [Telmatospirillum sp. J64-1]